MVEFGRSLWTTIDKHGRVVVPASVREQLNLLPGTRIRVWVEDGTLKMMTLEEGIKQAQAIVRQITGGRPGILDEFLAERRRDSGD